MTAPTDTLQPEMLMDEAPQRLALDSRLEDLARVRPWVDALATRCAFEANVRYALHLCVEEALANIVLHGYRSEPGHRIRVAYQLTGEKLLVTIEDDAPPFVPPPSLPPGPRGETPSLASIQPGGNGLRFLHHFAGSLSYESTAHGNRLTLGFPL